MDHYAVLVFRRGTALTTAIVQPGCLRFTRATVP